MENTFDPIAVECTVISFASFVREPHRNAFSISYVGAENLNR